MFCRACGFVLRCPRCDLPLTFHSDQEAAPLRCHTCAYTRQMPKTCPNCGSKHIRQYGTGTEKVEAEVKERFPEARVLRWDYETTRAKGAHDILLSHFVNRRADVLVGTQMLAKGLDLPLVTLVGVVLADVGLNLPDFRAAERTFQLLMQVAGRAGRSPLGGKVVLQTFMPDHYAIRAAASYDFEGFTQRELEYRRQTHYPPFIRLARLEYRSLYPAQAEQAALALGSQLQGWIEAGHFSASELIGPAPCFYGKRNGYYRWHIVLRSPDPAAVLRGPALGDSPALRKPEICCQARGCSNCFIKKSIQNKSVLLFRWGALQPIFDPLPTSPGRKSSIIAKSILPGVEETWSVNKGFHMPVNKHHSIVELLF